MHRSFDARSLASSLSLAQDDNGGIAVMDGFAPRLRPTASPGQAGQVARDRNELAVIGEAIGKRGHSTSVCLNRLYCPSLKLLA